jgi:hypothetical protein
VTLERARERALAVDERTNQEITNLLLGPPREVFSQIRAYLLRRADEMSERNYPHQLVKFIAEDSGLALIELGPRFDKGLEPTHFRFDSGARLSFGIILREISHRSQLVSFRYHYHLPAEGSPKYLRFDLNKVSYADPPIEPRCHLHPGLEKVRIPLSLHDPLEILDRIFFVLERDLES